MLSFEHFSALIDIVAEIRDEFGKIVDKAVFSVLQIVDVFFQFPDLIGEIDFDLPGVVNAQYPLACIVVDMDGFKRVEGVFE